MAVEVIDLVSVLVTALLVLVSDSKNNYFD